MSLSDSTRSDLLQKWFKRATEFSLGCLLFDSIQNGLLHGELLDIGSYVYQNTRSRPLSSLDERTNEANERNERTERIPRGSKIERKSDQTPTSPNLLLVFVCFQNYVNITCFCTYHYIATEIRRNKHNSSRFLEYERLNLLHGRLGVYRDAHITTLPSSIVYLVSLVFSNLTILNTMTCTVPHRKRTRLGINQHHERHQRTMNV